MHPALVSRLDKRKAITQTFCAFSALSWERVFQRSPKRNLSSPREKKLLLCCAVLWSASEKPFPINSTIVSSSKDLQSEKSKAGGLYWGWRLNADTSTSLYKIEFLSEWQERSQLLQVSGGAHLYVVLGESTLEWSELSFRSSAFWGLYFFLFQTCISCYSGLSIFQPGYWSATSGVRSSLDGFFVLLGKPSVGCMWSFVSQ